MTKHEKEATTYREGLVRQLEVIKNKLEKVDNNFCSTIHCIGEKYKNTFYGEEFILVSVYFEHAALINLHSGKRWGDIVKIEVDGYVTEREFTKICGSIVRHYYEKLDS